MSVVVTRLESSITTAVAADRAQGEEQVRAVFLAKLEELGRTVNELNEMIQAVEAHLAPKPNWKNELKLSTLMGLVQDFRDRLTRQDLNTVGVYDNFSQILEPILQHAKNTCDGMWVRHRDSVFTDVPLDFEYPNENILGAIAPGLSVPPRFSITKRLLNSWSTMSFGQVWDDDSGRTSSGFSAAITANQERIDEYLKAITPVVDALAGTPAEVAQFLKDASTGTATLAQAIEPQVARWLEDSNLSDSFALRFKDSG